MFLYSLGHYSLVNSYSIVFLASVEDVQLNFPSNMMANYLYPMEGHFRSKIILDSCPQNKFNNSFA